jgi:hypothetical protein
MITNPNNVKFADSMSTSSPMVDMFVKSSIFDFQDPVFLTFVVDFFPSRAQFATDGISNDNLLIGPKSFFVNNAAVDPTRYSRESSITSEQAHSLVEYSAYDWLTDYYGVNYTTMPNSGGTGYNPAVCLGQTIKGLSILQSSPWYFQSVQGISDLWKTISRVKEGNKKTTLTFNCLESIKQPLTDIAENYRYAIYDEQRLSYRLPDNLRWFDMEISLIEIRNLVDYNTYDKTNDYKLFKKTNDGNTVAGLKVIKFRLKMCEFDFSDFIAGSGGQTEHKISTDDKPFSPSFKVNVGWVEHQPVPLSEVNDIKTVHNGDRSASELGNTYSNRLGQFNLFGGAAQGIANRINNITSTAMRLPGAIVGSFMNDIQTALEGKALGNVYDEGGLNGVSGAINKFGASLTGRQAPVGPPITSNLKSDIYPTLDQPTSIGNGDLGDVYP